MPPRRRRPGEIDPNATHLCNCTRYCKGLLSSVDIRMFNRHAPHRTTPEEVLVAYYQANPNALGQRVPAGLSGPGRSVPGPGGSGAPQTGPWAAPHGPRSVRDSARRGTSPGRAMDIDPVTPPSLPRNDPSGGSQDESVGHAPPPGPASRPASPTQQEQDEEQPRPPLPFRIPSSPPPLPPRPHSNPGTDEENAEEGYADARDKQRTGYKEDVRIANYFIRGLRDATIASSGLDDDTLARMHSPRKELPKITPFQRAAFRMFLARGDASEDNYADNRAAIQELHPEDEIPSYGQVKALIGSYTGIDAVRTDMCVNTCVAYTGAFAHLPKCPECAEPRYDPAQELRSRKVPRRTFSTFPIGPQLQTLYASPETARLMHHRATRTEAIREQLCTRGPESVTHFDDIYFANDYLELVGKQTIMPDDAVLMFSLDGAQLYQNKGSDCWFYVWILFDLPPTHRYKKQFVLPGGVIGGPQKLKNIDSFLFPGLYHLAALQNDGLQIWDADRRIQFRSNPFLYLSTADAPGMAYLNGLVGHSGRYGCQIYCGQRGYHKPGRAIYYPALLCPSTVDVAQLSGSSEDEAEAAQEQDQEGRRNGDKSLRNLRVDSAADIERYARKLHQVVTASSQTDYERRRLHTGISWLNIMSGLPRAQKPPRGFGLDLMHLISLNMTDLVLSIFRGTIVCDDKQGLDTKTSWDFTVLADKDVWKDHGALIGAATRYLPTSFNRPPRNPQQKISSGYKAWEFLQYTYGLLPAYLRTLLAPVYYRHFCKLVLGVRLLLQRNLDHRTLPTAQLCIIQYIEDFENLYYVRRMERLHFVRPCLHTLAHIVSEIERTGLCSLYMQWTLENYIGSITREIRQHVTPYANVSERALRRCQINALRSMIPAFAIPQHIPCHFLILGDEYVLLSPYESSPQPVSALEVPAMHSFYQQHGIVVEESDHPIVSRWARLQLPTGQLARTAWKEVALEDKLKEPRRARMAKLRNQRFVEIQYFFQNTIHDQTLNLAMVSLFSTPDPNILKDSVYTLCACKYRGDLAESYHVVDVKEIVSVIAMIPMPMTPEEALHPEAHTSCFFAVEKPGLDVAYLAGHTQLLDQDTEADN